jgi:hypothetical protein
MSFRKIPPPAWACTASPHFASIALHNPMPLGNIRGDHGTTLVVHGLKAPNAEGAHWVSVSIDYHFDRSTRNHSACLDADAGRALRDLLCELYGAPDVHVPTRRKASLRKVKR